MNGAVDLTGYHLSFDAEMTSASDMRYFINTFNNGDRTISSNGELESYANYDSSGSTYSFQNGALVITASPTPSNGLPYTSGLISTGYTFYQNTGYFEVRAQTPSTSGFWPAFWMLAGGPSDYTSEVDVLEQPNNNGVSNYFDSVKTPQYNQGLFQNTGVDLSAGYHSYGFMWTSTAVQFTFDGQYVGQAVATPAALANLKMYLFANLAVGGWAATPASGASAQLKIDYIRAYSNDASVPTWWGGVEAISSPDGVNTTPNLTGTTTGTTTGTGTSTGTTTTTTTPVVTAGPTVIGSGNDTLTLMLNEDAYNGDAQFTVSVDGVQIGGTQTTTASHSAGGAQEFDVKGSFAPGAHTATVNFTNDAYGGPGLDRNLYVASSAINGTAVTGGSLSEYSNGAQSFSFSGGDTLTLGVSEDAYAGDAQYRVLVDGYYVNGTYTATASHSAGLINTQTISGSWGKGAHTVGIQFINDAYGGPGLDRNLYINSVSFDGGAAPMSGTIAQGTNGVASVSVLPTSTLGLLMSEDAYNGNAQFTLTVDGKQMAANTGVTASHAAGATQALDFNLELTAGLHDIGITFTNDAYGGSPSLDRNLYLSGASLNGTALGASAWTQNFYSNGTSHFSLVVPSS